MYKRSLKSLCVSLWRTIRQGWPAFSKSIHFEVGVGDKIKSWHHVWCGSCTLWEAFPELYNISCNKESSIADVMHFPNQRLHWDLFSRAPQDWETEQFYTFLDLINSMPLNGEDQDKLCWKRVGNKNFKVSEYYLSLSSTLDISSFAWKPMWHSKVPPKVAFFSWTTALGKILTIENLWYKGVTIVDWCYICKKSGESVNHLLLHCPIAYELWSMVWTLFVLLWVMLPSDLFSSWQGSFGGHRSINLWRAVPHCILWCILRERISRCFEGKKQSIS